MMITVFWFLAQASWPLIAILLYLRVRRLRRDLAAETKLRDDIDLAKVSAMNELDETKRFLDRAERAIKGLEHANYNLGCELLGKEEVDRMMLRARCRSFN